MDLRGHDLITYDTGPYVGPGFEWWAEAVRVCRVSFTANDPAALCAAARAGLGIAVLPHCLAEPCAELRRVEGAPAGATDVLVVMREAERRSAPIRPVVQLVASLVRQHQATLYQPQGRRG